MRSKRIYLTYVLHPQGIQSGLIVDCMLYLKYASAVKLDPLTARANPGTIALLFVDGPICRKKHPRWKGRQAHYRIQQDMKDLQDAKLQEIPPWAENAGIVVMVQKIGDEQLRDPAVRSSFQNAIRQMHRECIKLTRAMEYRGQTLGRQEEQQAA